MLRKLLIPLIALTLFASGAEKKVNTISCEPSLVYKCTLQGCEKIKVVNIDEADIQHFEIDLEKRSIVGKIGNATVDAENIVSRHGNENTFIFFGTHADSAHDWILRIDKKSKQMILLATNEEEEGFTVYGTCSWEEGR